MKHIYVDFRHGSDGIWWFEGGVLMYAPVGVDNVVDVENDQQIVEDLNDPLALFAIAALTK